MVHLRVASLAFFVIAFGSLSVGHAEPAPVMPPRPAEPTHVAYPVGAHGDAEVVLELTVSKDGAVRDLSVVSGIEPFTSTCVDAAAGWHFEPATRDGRPVAARIRMAIRFRQPEPAKSVPPPASALPGALTQPPASPAPPIEVLVIGERPDRAPLSLSQAEVRELPGAFGDPFRAIEALPGVTPLVSGAPYYYVRGAPPGNIGYFFDDVRVPLLYHIGLGPGVIHPSLIERVDFYPGAYPARYGRFAGGIVAGESAVPPPEWHGEANVRLVDSGAMLTAPFAGERGVATVAGRYSYTAAILSLLVPDTKLEYWDYQARVGYELGRHDRLSVLVFGAYDLLEDVDRSGNTRVLFGTDFHRLDLRHDHAFSRHTELRTAATLGFDRTRTEGQQRPDVRDRMIGARTMLKHELGEGFMLRAGADVNLDAYDVELRGHATLYGYSTERLERLLPGRNDLATGIWGEAVLPLGAGVTVVPGLRLDWYRSRGESALGVDPRILARFAVSRRVRLVHAVGIAHQPPSFIVPIPGLALSDLHGGLQKSVQTSAGVESDLPEHFFGSLTLFQNTTFDATDTLAAAQVNGGLEFAQRSRARTVGLELMLRRPLSRRVGGFLSYTLSRSIRSLHAENVPSAFDRTHVLNVAPYYDLGRGWRLGSRLVFYTGIPTDWVQRHPRRRTLPFYRLDLRASKRWRIGTGGAWWGVNAEVLNAMLNREELDVSCTALRCDHDRIGPVTIPSLGVEAAF